ncbi:hypothetical protein HC031_21640 [Planosporangium thailandense]|uniref:DUF3618 domain-containing protein n=1 Tax=Planosporangium thailandense TaxID=765197 RepID=A0ABX0Y1S4_9ACTN|nr:hypothetical protein [Planosporangium thailandense]NJC72298.1 hypothetical protein [Planosporangium thailandense]
MPATKQRLISVVSEVAGVAADPKTGLSKAKSKLMSPRTALIGICLLAAYIIGRRAANRDED